MQLENKYRVEGIITYTLINEDGSIAETGTLKNKNVILNILLPAYTKSFEFFARIEQRVMVPTASYIKTSGYIERESTGTTIQCEMSDASDAFIEHTYRFQSDGNEHQIHGFSYLNGYNYAIADPVFIQSGTQVLEIKYRMIYSFSQIPADLPYVFGIKLILKKYKFVNYLRYTYLIPNSITCVPGQILNNATPSSDSAFGTSAPVYDEVTIDKGIGYHTYNKLEQMHYVLNGLNLKTTCFNRNYIDGEDNVHSTYPFGALYNHSKNSQLWCEDISNLATGMGYIGVSTLEPEYTFDNNKEIEIIKITKSGNAGAAEYNLVKYPLLDKRTYSRALGSYGISPVTGIQIDGRKDIVCNTNYPAYTEINPQYFQLSTWVPFDHKRAMLATRTCLAVVNPLSGEIWRYDSNDGFPVVTIGDYTRDMASNDVGSIFINTGTSIVKVDNLTNTNATSHITIGLADIGASGSAIEIMKVMPNGYIIVKAGGLYESTDDGATWSEVVISVWSSTVTSLDDINYIVVSPKNNNEMVFSKDSYKNAWFDKSTGICTTFSGANAYTKLECEPVHGIWYANFLSYYHNSSAYLVFKEDASLSSTKAYPEDHNASYNSYNYRHNLPYYDALGNFHLVGQTRIASGHTILYSHSLGDNSYLYVDDRLNIISGYSRKHDYNRHVKADTDKVEASLNFSDNNTMCMLPGSGSYLYDCSDEPDSLYKFVDNRQPLTYELSGVLAKKWDAGNSEWVDFNQPALASSAIGNIRGPAQRINFLPNKSTFNGRCYLDISEGLGNKNFDTGMTLLAQFDPTVKFDNPNFTGVSNPALKPEEQTIAWFSIHNKSNNTGFALLYKNKDNNMVIQDYTGNTPTDVVISATPTVANVRVAMVISSTGDTIQVFIDDVLEGTVVLSSALNMDNSGGDLKVIVGASQWHPVVKVSHYGRLFKGSITNIQVFDQALTPTLVHEDFTADPHIVADITKLQSIWYMDATDYNESKPTHSSYDMLPNQTMLKFDDSSDPATDSFVADDNYCVAILKNGFLKGNSETLRYRVSTAWNKVKIPFMYNALGGNTVLGTQENITGFRPSFEGTIQKGNTVLFDHHYYTTSVDAKFIAPASNNTVSMEFTPQFTPNTDTGNNFYAKMNNGGNVIGITWDIDGTSDIGMTGVANTSIPGKIMQSGDRIKLELAGTVFNVYIDTYDGNGFVLVSSETVPDTNVNTTTMQVGKGSIGYNTLFFLDIRINADVLPGTMFYGDPISRTGMFSNDCLRFTSLWKEKNITVDGTLVSERLIDTDIWVNDTNFVPTVGMTQCSNGVTIFNSSYTSYVVKPIDFHYEKM